MKTIELFEQMMTQRAGGDVRKAYSNAQWYCANAYEFSQKAQSDILIFKDLCWGHYVQEMCELLEKQDIFEFCFASAGTSTLERMKEFQDAGWRLKEVVMVPTTLFDGNHRELSPGIVMTRAMPINPVRVMLIRRRESERKSWADEFFLLVSDEEAEQMAQLPSGVDEKAEAILRKRVQAQLATADGWANICWASKDFNWGDFLMRIAYDDIGAVQSIDKTQSCKFFADINVDQDELLAPSDVTATLVLNCIRETPEWDNKQERIECDAVVDFRDGTIYTSVEFDPVKIASAYIRLSNGDILDCDPDEDFLMLKTVRKW